MNKTEQQANNDERLLDDLVTFLGRFNVYPSDHAKIACALWIAHTHLIDGFQTTPRLAVLSAEKQSGKTRLVEVAQLLVRKALASMNVSPAAMYTAVSQMNTPTLLLDEIDRTYEKRDTAELTALINSGFRRGQKVYRCKKENAQGNRELEELEAFCPVLISGLDKNQIPDTILDRSIIIRMKKRKPDERVEQFRFRQVEPEANALRARLEDGLTTRRSGQRKRSLICQKA